MSELWKQHPRYEKYEVGDQGEVRNKRTRTTLSPTSYETRSRKVTLFDNAGNRVGRSVGLLVAETHLPPPPRGLFNTPIHKNGNKSDCRASNLEWRPRWYAIRYHRQFSDPSWTKQDHRVRELTTNRVFHNIRAASVEFGVHFKDIILSAFNEEPFPLTGHEFRIEA